jgi:UDP-glucose 4-epimerase
VISEISSPEECVLNCDFVFHMAALRINVSVANPQDGFDVMMKSTFDLATLCANIRSKNYL